MLEPYTTEYLRYKLIAENALAQVSDDALNHIPVSKGNSIAMLVRHLSGNLLSRFTDFLSSDGEKSWRDRDMEFHERSYTRKEVSQMWQQAWHVLEQVLGSLSDADLSRTVQIRGQALRIDAALARSISHLSYHVGQIVLLARLVQGEAWQWISIPKGQSAQYNMNPTKERRPG